MAWYPLDDGAIAHDVSADDTRTAIFSSRARVELGRAQREEHGLDRHGWGRREDDEEGEEEDVSGE
jgi:hypothetical protein